MSSGEASKVGWPSARQRGMLSFCTWGCCSILYGLWGIWLEVREGPRGKSWGQHAEDVKGQADNGLFRPRELLQVSEAGILGV